MKSVSILILLVALTATSGCGTSGTTPTTPVTTPTTTTVVTQSDPNAVRNASVIQIATAQAVALGLNVYANEGHAAEALLIAQKMKELVSTSALPYLNGTSGASSSAVNAFLNGQFVTLPDEAQSLIALAATLLDSYLPAPSANAVLDADQLLYVKAFFNGLNDGASQIVSNPPVAPAVAKPKSVQAKSTAAWFNTNK